jgi:glycosyltransferase involved in cell wall biosynthesis
MNKKVPFFSIVIPTRNRGKMLVESAIPSVIDQDFDDYEIVVCDNNSSDNTKELVYKLIENNNRIRYVYSSEWIPKEKFFEFSLKQANGEYSILFFDDDVFVKGALKFCYEILSKFNVPVFTFSNKVVYFYPDWLDAKMKNVLKVPFYTGEIILKNSNEQLKGIYDELDLISGSPDVTNSFYKTSFILNLINKYGTLLPYGHMGDYTIACYSLANTDYYFFYDGPIIIFGHWSQNTSQQLRLLKTTMEEYKKWIEWAKENLLKDMPFKEYLFSNCIVATLLKMKNQLDLEYHIDIQKYFQKLYRDIQYIKPYIKDKAFILEKRLLEAMRNLNVKVNFSSPNQPKIIQTSQIFKGDTYGFNNITGARIFFNSIQSQNKYYFRTYTTSKFISIFLKFGSRILRKISKKTHKKILKFLRKIALYVLSKEVEE